MSDANDRVVALLEELIALQKTAIERQLQAQQKAEQFQDEARARAERAIELQRTALQRQRAAMRVWAGATVFILACVLGLLIAVAHYLHR